MIINTVETNTCPRPCQRGVQTLGVGLAWVLLTLVSLHAGPVFEPWTPLFKGVDHTVGTNDPSIPGNFPVLQVVHCVRVDLTDPDISLLSTPRAPGYVAESRETLTQTVPQFLAQHQVQIAADANFYSAANGGSDPPGSGLSCEVFGLQISAGTMVSAQTSADASGDPRYATLLFNVNNQPFFSFVNRPPGTNTAGIFTAITGYYPIVSNGVNIGNASINAYPDSWIHQRQPRTAYGVSQDSRYLYILSIDGRQSGYSDGALDVETAYWLLQTGSWNGINMDGGGSTALYMADSVGNPVPLNHSSYVAGTGHERYIGSHIGVFAKPLPGFFNDVNVTVADTSAAITWTTLSPATTQVQYGTNSNLGSWSDLSSTLVTNHSVLLSGLTPGTAYYFQALGTNAGGAGFVSPNFSFTTTNYVTTNIELTSTWSYNYQDLDGVNWQAPSYDDSSWSSGPGVLWVDASGVVNPGIPVPSTEMPTDPSTLYPYITYYFRTHFTPTNAGPGSSMIFEVYLDDGAVFYLNGTEIHRAFMAAYPTPILNNTLAIGYNCSTGNATCPYDFVISGDLATNLVAGDNVLAVEVHNYNAASPDITFGLSLATQDAVVPQPELSITASNSVVTLNWSGNGYVLQQADSLTGSWTDVPGPVLASPYSAPASASAKYYRLRK